MRLAELLSGARQEDWDSRCDRTVAGLQLIHCIVSGSLTLASDLKYCKNIQHLIIKLGIRLLLTNPADSG